MCVHVRVIYISSIDLNFVSNQYFWVCCWSGPPKRFQFSTMCLRSEPSLQSVALLLLATTIWRLYLYHLCDLHVPRRLPSSCTKSFRQEKRPIFTPYHQPPMYINDQQLVTRHPYEMAKNRDKINQDFKNDIITFLSCVSMLSGVKNPFLIMSLLYWNSSTFWVCST